MNENMGTKLRCLLLLLTLVLLFQTVGADPVDAPPFAGEKSSFYSYDRYDFIYDGRACIVVTPKVVAAGKPWIWRARFFGHEPQTDIALLEQGYHLVYSEWPGCTALLKPWRSGTGSTRT